MAISQPQSTDNLNNPDHAKLHRVLGVDTAASDKAVVVESTDNVGIGIEPSTLASPTLFNVGGAITFHSSSQPAIAESNTGVMYFDSSTGFFRVSENGEDFIALRGSAKIDKNTTNISYANSTTEKDLVNFTLGAYRLGTDNVLQVTADLSDLDILDTDSITFRLYYGGSLIATSTITNDSNSSVTNNRGVIDASLFADNSTSDQEGCICVRVGSGSYASPQQPAGSAFGAGHGDGAIDSTQSQIVQITAQWSTADTGNSLTKENSYAIIHE